MLKLVTTGQFRKDYKRMKKRGYNINLLEEAINLLQNNKYLQNSGIFTHPVLEAILFRSLIFPKIIYNRYRANHHNYACGWKSYVLYILWI